MFPSLPPDALPAAPDTPPGAPALLDDAALAAIGDWLHEVATTLSPSSWLNYRKEIERFLIWLRSQQLTPAQVQRQHVNAYQQLLQRPPSDWVNPRRAPRSDPAWRPLAGPLKPSSIRQAMTILHNCFDWLLLHERAGVRRNPFRRVRVAREQASPFEERMLSPAALAWLRDSIEALPRERLSDFHHYYRARWLVALLLVGGLRREEVVSARLGDFRYDASYDVWTLRVLGKGNKLRDVTVTNELLAELRFYLRHALNRESLPEPDDPTPLLFALHRKGWRDPQPLCGQHLYKLVKTLLARAAERASASGQPHLARELAPASPHWFRHSSITAKLEAGVPIEDVAEEHGHANINTTQRYAHKARGRRAQRLAGLTLLDDGAGAPPKPEPD
ncbi:tyrosine-type recombinase/integrase [Crenobacter sp. SG2305]|uniref:tyrosine-type recombinase/integrase n=1 Tax=Crenobacter oryzisoli TaxID=3056844 RepID=UPI0025AAB190|nr:tyrosine-type recombinase/integrase [Crenobacter sp. SG2305]MDN0084667.1 tyrosine-type recombinase/integrase [Crenobacter sp. SG2305]